MSLTDDKQQNIQMELDFSSALTGAARGVAWEETESFVATSGSESPPDAAPGTSLGPKPFRWGFPMPTSNRSAFRRWSMGVSATNSNRRVRTRTHGGVAGVGG